MAGRGRGRPRQPRHTRAKRGWGPISSIGSRTGKHCSAGRQLCEPNLRTVHAPRSYLSLTPAAARKAPQHGQPVPQGNASETRPAQADPSKPRFRETDVQGSSKAAMVRRGQGNYSSQWGSLSSRPKRDRIRRRARVIVASKGVVVSHHPCAEAAIVCEQGPNAPEDSLYPVRKGKVSRFLQECSNVLRCVGAHRCTRVSRRREESGVVIKGLAIPGQERRQLLPLCHACPPPH